jgi:hypothetical protein
MFLYFLNIVKVFNGKLGPSHKQAVILFETITDQQRAFLQRYEGGIVGTHLAAHHHHNVLVRLQIHDESSGQKFSPIDGIFNVMNERHQCLAYWPHLLQHGTSRNENFWRHFRASFLEVVSLSFGDSLANMLICGWNFNQELQFNAQWSYILIPTMHILLIQEMALRSRDD